MKKAPGSGHVGTVCRTRCRRIVSGSLVLGTERYAPSSARSVSRSTLKQSILETRYQNDSIKLVQTEDGQPDNYLVGNWFIHTENKRYLDTKRSNKRNRGSAFISIPRPYRRIPMSRIYSSQDYWTSWREGYFQH